MEDIVMQLETEIQTLKNGQNAMISIIQILTNQVVTLTETCAALAEAYGYEREARYSAPTDQCDSSSDESWKSRMKQVLKY